ncbi:MAG TPA: LLM class F420-dependent oxidoreductase [Jatrophihabitantaceae bacterium]|nr:LLM class F420-dependent oxidoreductase [Jatrophihabitantaceae bacterium]
MKIGVVLPSELASTADPDWVSAFATRAEALGYDEISVVEHSVVIADTSSTYPYAPDGRSPLPDDCPLPDPLELLAFVAARTERLGLATGVLVLPNHHPVVLAKRLATLDRLSGGRLRICLGVGWMREEIEACGGDFEHRGALADEAIAAMRALWRDTSAAGASFDGTRYRFARAHSWPKPVRPDGVPLFIGGHSTAAARRAGRIGDGFQPLGLAGDDLAAAVATMRDAAREAGRDPSEVELVLGATLGRVDAERVEQAAAQGASRLLLSVSRGASTPEDVLGQLDSAAQRLGLAR